MLLSLLQRQSGFDDLGIMLSIIEVSTNDFVGGLVLFHLSASFQV